MSREFAEVYRPANHAELGLVKSYLDEAGIQYFVKNELASIGAFVATGDSEIIIMAETSRTAEAGKLIRSFLE